ncbi:FecR family protein [Flavihumibacter sp. UBA7668]|uniref:FecR family protein n=1 Tax=Flavihumibacter sp. UBA7668 TaxID=1946542 RepID=UPI0025C04536|nr:FecR family protein [Flavihumibacter sp. UBA7668]
MDKKALIRKFLNNQSTPDEAVLVTALLKENPELLEELLPEEEWNATDDEAIPFRLEEEMDSKVHRATTPFRLPAFIRPISIAASILALITTLFFWNSKPPAPQQLVAEIKPAVVPVKLYDTILNTGQKQLFITLDDGSTVKLYGNAGLIVPSSMKKSRELQLFGKAQFEVAKNPELPFVVKSGAVSTTALGTVFMVDATKKESAIHIALYEGKVVVKALDPALSIEDTYLSPGQQCDIDILTEMVAVSAIPKLTQIIKPQSVLPIADALSNEQSLSFVKVPLAIVFDRLEKRFSTSIQVDSSLIDSKLFTGSFEETDSLELILHIIGTMNKLAMVKKDGSYFIGNEPKLFHTEESFDLIAGLVSMDERSMNLAPTLPFSESVKKSAGTIEKTTGGDLYQKMELPSLFDHLQNKHNIRILYNREQVADIIFTGVIPDDNSYINMLQVICRMNNLKLHKLKRGNYSVEPQQ